MKLEQTISSSPNDRPYVVTDGRIGRYHFIAYASGSHVIFLSPEFEVVQSLTRTGNTRTIVALHCCDADGKLLVCYSNEVVVYKPVGVASSEGAINIQWREVAVVAVDDDDAFLACNWDRNGGRFLLGSNNRLSLWCDAGLVGQLSDTPPESPLPKARKGRYTAVWSRRVGNPIQHLLFSLNAQVFVSSTLNDRNPKLWYRRPRAHPHISRDLALDFCYLRHPRGVVALSWRFPKLDTDRNTLLTSCEDGLCRLWAETAPYEPFAFFCSVVIGPSGGGPPSTSPFVLHWMPTADLYRFSNEGLPLGRSNRPNPPTDEQDEAREIIGLNLTSRSPHPAKAQRAALRRNKSVDNLQAPLQPETPRSLSQPPSEPDTLHELQLSSTELLFAHIKHNPPTSIDGQRQLPSVVSSRDEDLTDILFNVEQDGSLTFWKVEYLCTEPRRSPRVKVLSRGPPVIPLIDACSPCLKVLIHGDAQWLDPPEHPTPDQPPSPPAFSLTRALGRINSRVGSSIAQDTAPSDHAGYEFATPHTFPIGITLHHNNGVLAHLRVHFQEGTAFAQIASIDSAAQCVGHTRPIARMQAHPSLPYALSLTAPQDPAGHVELVLWKANNTSITSSFDVTSPSVRVMCRLKLPLLKLTLGVTFLTSHQHVSWLMLTAGGLCLHTSTSTHSLLLLSSTTVSWIDVVRVLSHPVQSSTTQETHRVLVITRLGRAYAWDVVLTLKSADEAEPGTEWTVSSSRIAQTFASSKLPLPLGAQLQTACMALGVLPYSSGLVDDMFLLLVVYDRRLGLLQVNSELQAEALTITSLDETSLADETLDSVVCAVSSTGLVAVRAVRDGVEGCVQLFDLVAEPGKLTSLPAPPPDVSLRQLDFSHAGGMCDLLLLSCDDALTAYLPTTTGWKELDRCGLDEPPTVTCAIVGGLVLVSKGAALEVLNRWLSQPKSGMLEANPSASPSLFALSYTKQGNRAVHDPVMLLTLLRAQRLSVAQTCLDNVWTACQPHVDASVQSALNETIFGYQKKKEDYAFLKAAVQASQPVVAVPEPSLATVLAIAGPVKASTKAATITALFASPDEADLGAATLTASSVDKLQQVLQHVRLTKLRAKDQAQLGSVLHAATVLTRSESDLDAAGRRYNVGFQLLVAEAKQGNSHSMAMSDIFWGLLSDAQTTLVDSIKGLALDTTGPLRNVEPTGLVWGTCTAAGLGFWLKSQEELKKAVDLVAKTTCQLTDDPFEAAAFYVLLNKARLVSGLFKAKGNARMATFFSHDFTVERWVTAALKNAFVLVSKRRYMEAVAFFLLGKDVKAAISICLRNLQDLQLALVVSRLASGDHSEAHKAFLKESLLPLALSANDDVFQALVVWLQRDYTGSFDILDGASTELPSTASQLHEHRTLAKYHLRAFIEQHSQVKGKRALARHGHLQAAVAYARQGMPVFGLELIKLAFAPETEATDAGANTAQLSEQDMIASGTFSFDSFGGFGGMGGMGGMGAVGTAALPDASAPKEADNAVKLLTIIGHNVQVALSAQVFTAECRVSGQAPVSYAAGLTQLESSLLAIVQASSPDVADGEDNSIATKLSASTCSMVRRSLTRLDDLAGLAELLYWQEPKAVMAMLDDSSQQLLRCADHIILNHAGKDEPTPILPAIVNTVAYESFISSLTLRRLAITPQNKCVVSSEQLMVWVGSVFVAQMQLAWQARDFEPLIKLAANSLSGSLWQQLFGEPCRSVAEAAEVIASPKGVDPATTWSLLQQLFPVVLALDFTDVDLLGDFEIAETGVNTDTCELDDNYTYRWVLLELLLSEFVVLELQSGLEAAGVDVSELTASRTQLYVVICHLERRIAVLQSTLAELVVPDKLSQPRGSSEGEGLALTTNRLFKMRSLLTPSANPFEGIQPRRLWHCLLKHTAVQSLLDYYVFQRDVVPASTAASSAVNSASSSVGNLAEAVGDLEKEWQTVLTCHNDVVDMVITTRSSHVRLALATSKNISEVDPKALATGTTEATTTLTRSTTDTKRLCTHPRYDIYASAGHDDLVALWSFDQEQHAGSYSLTKNSSGSRTTHTAFDLYGCRFGLSESDGLLSLWQFAQQSSGVAFRQLTTELKKLEYFEFLSASVIAMGGQPSSKHAVEVWDTLLPAHKAVVRRFDGLDAGIKSMLYLPEQQQLLCGSVRGSVSVIDMRMQRLLKTLPLHDAAVRKMILCEDGRHVASTGSDGAVRLWDTKTGAERQHWQHLHGRGRMFGERAADLATRNGILYSVGADNVVRSIDIASYLL